VDLNIDAEEGTEEGQQLVSGDEVVQGFALVHEDEEGSEEVNHNDVHNGVFVQGLHDSGLNRAELTKEFGDEGFGLSVIEEWGVIFLEEVEFEVGVVNQFFYLLDELLWFWTVDFEADLQVLIVEDTDVTLRVVEERLDYAIGVDQILGEEFW